MTPFPRPDYDRLSRYEPGRSPVAVDLSDNTNLWGAHPAALERIRRASVDDLARYPQRYADVLRDAVAERFGVPPECVTTGAGSDDVLDSAYRAAYAPGAGVAYAAPTFSMVESFARMNGMATHAVPWPEARNDPTHLVETEPDLVYVCRPNNPTGESAPAAWVERLLEACRTAGSGHARPLLIVDEAYGDFAGESLIPWAASRRNVLVIRTASKAYGLAGMRCGFAVGAAETVLAVDKSRGPYKVAGLTAEATAAAMHDASGWMADRIAECLANRERLHEELEARALVPPRSAANFLLCPAPSGSAADDVAALRRRGVGVRGFGDIPGLGDGLRVTVGPWPMMETFLQALDERLEEIAPGSGPRGAPGVASEPDEGGYARR